MKLKFYSIAIISALIAGACSENPKLSLNISEKYQGQTVELISLLDSTVLAATVIPEGNFELMPDTDKPIFTTVAIDGRTRAFYITEQGKAILSDSLTVAKGTKLNDRFSVLLTQLDSVEQYDDMPLYLEFVEKSYNDNKDNPIGSYFGIEWLKYADPEKVDSFMNLAPADLKNSPKAGKYCEVAKIRALTAPGSEYTDFDGEDALGGTLRLSDYVKPGNFTVIDFWASWCPYCIKELPDLKSFYEKWKDNGVEIVGVAVRDLPEDTRAAVNKHSIEWPVIYNVQRKPYDIYGFSGIPHHILIGPDGKIISRGENISQIEERIKNLK